MTHQHWQYATSSEGREYFLLLKAFDVRPILVLESRMQVFFNIPKCEGFMVVDDCLGTTTVPGQQVKHAYTEPQRIGAFPGGSLKITRHTILL